jgi:hypothetical protein
VVAVTGRLLWMPLQPSIVDGRVVRLRHLGPDTYGMCLVQPGRWWLGGGSACRCPDPQPVAIRVTKLDLTPIWRLTSGSAKLGHNGVNVTDYQMDQSVWPGVTLVLGQEQPRAATRDRHERGHTGLEAVLPFLGETQALIPGDRRSGTGDTKDRDHFLNHAGMVSRAWDKRPAPGHGYYLSPLVQRFLAWPLCASSTASYRLAKARTHPGSVNERWRGAWL